MPYSSSSTGLVIALHNVRRGRWQPDEADEIRRLLVDADAFAEAWRKEVGEFRDLLDEARQAFLTPRPEAEMTAAVAMPGPSCCSHSSEPQAGLRNKAEAAMLLSHSKLLDAQADAVRARVNAMSPSPG